MRHKKSHARQRTLLAVIAAGGIAIGGGPLAVAGEGDGPSATSDRANVREAAGVTMAQATDMVLQKARNGRVTQAVATRESGRDVFKVDFVQGSRTLRSTVDAGTGEILGTVNAVGDAGASTASGGSDSASGTASCDDDADDAAEDARDEAEDQAEDQAEDEGDDDDGPIRDGVEPSK